MKKLFNLSAIIIIASMLFTSCSKQTSLTLTKRLYRKGYYVNFGIAENNKQNTIDTKAAPIAKLNPIENSPILLANNTSVENLQKLAEKQNSEPVIVSENKPVKQTHISKLINKAKTFNNNLINSANNVQLVKHNTASKNAQKGNSDKLHGGPEDILILLFCIFIPPIGVFLLRGLDTEFWLDLLLTILFFFPGMIYAIIVFLE